MCLFNSITEPYLCIDTSKFKGLMQSQSDQNNQTQEEEPLAIIETHGIIDVYNKRCNTDLNYD